MGREERRSADTAHHSRPSVSRVRRGGLGVRSDSRRDRVPVLRLRWRLRLGGPAIRPRLRHSGDPQNSIYLLHTPASKIVASYLDLSATPYSALVGASFAVLLALACLALDRLYDRPVRKLLTGLAARFRVTGRAGQPG